MELGKDLLEAVGPLNFDPNEVRLRFAAARDKRLREDGNDQFIEVAAEFSDYKDDPYLKAPMTRDPLKDTVEVAIIGGGFGGLLMGAELKKAGIDSVRIIEQGGDFGGTWYWNRYPGAMCDVESYIYLPLLEELGYLPKQKYSFGPEILEHSRRLARHFNLYENACLQTSVTELRWSCEEGLWRIRTNRDDDLSARYVVMANGPLNRPKLPAIPGINEFEEHSFHTSRWDYAYTGGNSTGGLDRLSDKRVAVIGTGATAIQCVPHLGEWAKELYVFQRTPSMVNPRNNRATDSEFAEELLAEPLWQKKRMDNFQSNMEGAAPNTDAVNDGWTELAARVTHAAVINMEQRLRRELSLEEAVWLVEVEDFKKMHEVYDRVDGILNDPELARSMKPDFRSMCKRPCFHDEYLQTFNRDNVTLVDTEGRGVDEFLSNGVRVGEQVYEVDCVIFATGFEVGTGFSRRCGYPIYGRDGLSLSEYWDKERATFQSYMVSRFPNLFNLAIGQNGVTPNQTHSLAEGARHVTHIIQEATARGRKTVEPTKEAQDKYTAEFKAAVDPLQADFFASCTPGYLNNEGSVENFSIATESYGPGAHQFFSELAAWRDTGLFQGLDFC
ncbi:MAG: NAD(P)/FAD-dependent oxidoreductase [Pseudomonadota bacterium]